MAEEFNSNSNSIRILAIVSPTCPECLAGAEVVKWIFAKFDSNKLKGFVLWIPMLENDVESAAQARSESIADPRIAQFWDGERNCGNLFARALHLDKTPAAWDVYLLYSPRMLWENEDAPPEPAFWMHQLSSCDPNLRLDSQKFADETRFLLEAEDPELAERDVAQVLINKKGAKEKIRGDG
jgi:hypothetical protein